MQRFLFVAMRVIGGLCLLLVMLVIAVAVMNERQQKQLQWRQQQLVQGVLGPEAQRISNEIIQDIGNTARFNPSIRALLSRYGYQVPGAADARNTRPAAAVRVDESGPAGENP